MTTQAFRIAYPTVFFIGEFSLILTLALFLCAFQSGLNISRGEDTSVGDIAYQPGVIVQTPLPSFGPPLNLPFERELPETEPSPPDRQPAAGDTASMDAPPAPQSEKQKDTPMDPEPVLAALWRGEPDAAQRYLDEQENQGRILTEDVRSLLADLLSAMTAQKAGNWRLAMTHYGQARNWTRDRARRDAASFATAVDAHVTLLFWLNFAMVRHAEKDYANARENLKLSRPKRVPDMTDFERVFHRRVAAQVSSLAWKQRNEKANREAETKTTPAPTPVAAPISAPISTNEHAGRTFPSPAAMPEMVTLPAGRFLMGDIQGDGYKDELPVREVVIPYAFALGRYEVTNGEYAAFLNERRPSLPERRRWIKTKAEEPASRIRRLGGVYRVTSGYEGRPVEHVSWFGALAYADWIAKRTGQPFRLPSEAEWEYATRAGTETRYWWGNEVGRNRANCNGCGSRWDGNGASPVGAFPANAFGLHDVHGNAWEWVRDCADDGSYKSAPADGGARERKGCRSRILRGGGWDRKPWYARSATRHRLLPATRRPAVGFRLARDGLSSGE